MAKNNLYHFRNKAYMGDQLSTVQPISVLLDILVCHEILIHLPSFIHLGGETPVRVECLAQYQNSDPSKLTGAQTSLWKALKSPMHFPLITLPYTFMKSPLTDVFPYIRSIKGFIFNLSLSGMTQESLLEPFMKPRLDMSSVRYFMSSKLNQSMITLKRGTAE